MPSLAPVPKAVEEVCLFLCVHCYMNMNTKYMVPGHPCTNLANNIPKYLSAMLELALACGSLASATEGMVGSWGNLTVLF